MGHVTITMSLSGVVCHPLARTGYDRPTTIFEVAISIHYEGDTKWGNRVVWVVKA